MAGRKDNPRFVHWLALAPDGLSPIERDALRGP
jgi:hypothetical protein